MYRGAVMLYTLIHNQDNRGRVATRRKGFDSSQFVTVHAGACVSSGLCSSACVRVVCVVLRRRRCLCRSS